MADENPFGHYSGDFTLTSVEVELHHVDSSHVETFKLAALDCSETRCVEWEPADEGEPEKPPTLSYMFFFETPGCIEPKGGYSGTECRTVIRGTHSNGCRIEMEGQAWPYVNIKASELNSIFDDPPKITILSGLPDFEDIAQEKDDPAIVQIKRA